MTRNDFLKGSLAATAMSASAGVFAGTKKNTSDRQVYTPLVSHDVAPRNRRPYSDVDWSRCQHVMTTSHGHCNNQRMLDAYLKLGYRFFTISNYYPSAPWYPAKEMTWNYYRVHHDHPVMVKGKRVDGPFDWNKIVSGWKDELPPERLKELPLKESEYKVFRWPEGMLEAPNAEHHNFLLENGKSAGPLHVCAPGSRYASGTFDAHDRFKTASHGYCYGTGEYWRTAFDRMIAELVDPEGGGLTINHPRWSKLDRQLILEMLDHDPRVLGMEVIENGRNAEHYWDWVLATGRQCFGMFVPDWALLSEAITDLGANILVVPELTVHECLKAYRQGNFYGSLRSRGELKFTNISFDGTTLKAATDKPAFFEIVTAQGVVSKVEGLSVSWSVPKDTHGEGPRVEVFARVRAHATDGSGEVLFSQAFMLV